MTITEYIDHAITAQIHRDELAVMLLLQHWVSELEPILVFDSQHRIIGLSIAAADLGSRPFILRLADLNDVDQS